MVNKKNLDPSDFFWENILKKISRQDFLLFGYGIFLGLLVHFTLYSEQLTNPDGLLCGFYHAPNDWEFSLGRWALAVIGWFNSFLVSPSLSTFFSLIVLSITCILLTKVLDIHMPLLKIAVVSSIMVSPATSQILSYYYCSYIYFSAFLFAVLATLIMRTAKGKIRFISIFLIALSIGIYQIYLSVAVAICLFFILYDFLKNTDLHIILKRGLSYIIFGGFGAFLYWIINKIVFYVKKLDFLSYGGANTFNLDTILSMLPISISDSYQGVYDFFFGNNISLIKNQHWHRELFWLILLFCTLLAIIIVLRNSKISIYSICCIALIILLMPIGIGFSHLLTPTYEFTLGISHPFYLILPMMLSVCELSFSLGKDHKRYKRFYNTLYSFILLCCCFITHTYILSVNATYIDRQIKTAQTNTVALRILDQVQQSEGYSADKKVLIVGAVTNNNFASTTDPHIHEMTYGHFSEWSIFWNSYENIKSQWNNIYANTYGININWASDEEYNEIINSQEFHDMSIFPNSGSVKIIYDVVVVKIEDNPPLPNQ